MNELFQGLVQKFFKIWSYLPIFAFTDDYNCYEYDPYRANEKKYRVSIFNLSLGDKSIYFLSWSWTRFNESKFDFLKILNINDNPSFDISDVKENDMQNKYIGHILDKNTNIEIEERAIETKIQLQQSRIDKNYMRLSIYAAIGAIVVPYLFDGINDNICISELSFLGIIFRITYLYAIINLIFILFDSIKISWIKSCLFSELKKAKCQRQFYLLQRYLDWQYLIRNADKSLTYSKKIHDWFYICIVFYAYVNIRWIEYFHRVNILIKEYLSLVLH